MNSESLGKKFKNGNQEYECIAYADKPTITMKNLETGEKINMVVGSMLANEFEEIIEEDKELNVEQASVNFEKFQKAFNRVKKELFPLINEIQKIEEDNNRIEKLKIDALEDLESKAIGRRVNQIIDKINNME